MKQVVVICYPNDWHWVLSTEFTNSHLIDSTQLEVWDLSWVGETSFRNRVKRLIGGNKFQRECKEWFKKNDIPFREYKSNSTKTSTIRYSYKKLINQFDYLDFDFHRTIYNTVVEEIGNLQVNTKKYKRQIMLQLRAQLGMRDALVKLNSSDIARFVTVNGRFTKNATVRDWAKEKEIPLVLLEFGSTEETIEEFEVSPHSVSEVTSKIVRIWEEAPKVHRVKTAEKYLKSVEGNKVSKIEWRAKMIEADLPFFPKGKKTCVFFASTESEEAGLGDPVNCGDFKSQVEAFWGLIEVLPEEEWHIFLRRHPRDPKTKSKYDPEEHLWDPFSDVKNVTIIEPDSSVDSIELGLQADLVANYWSGIALELLIRGQNSLITLGDTPWNHFIPSNSTRNKSEIKRFLAVQTPNFEIESIYPWAYYYATFGKPFELFQFDTEIAKWVPTY